MDFVQEANEMDVVMDPCGLAVFSPVILFCAKVIFSFMMELIVEGWQRVGRTLIQKFSKLPYNVLVRVWYREMAQALFSPCAPCHSNQSSSSRFEYVSCLFRN